MLIGFSSGSVYTLKRQMFLCLNICNHSNNCLLHNSYQVIFLGAFLSNCKAFSTIINFLNTAIYQISRQIDYIFCIHILYTYSVDYIYIYRSVELYQYSKSFASNFRSKISSAKISSLTQGKGHGFCFIAWNCYNGCQNEGLADNLPNVQILSIVALLQENAI